jgi:two-component system phosphate regulon sensor histidine kinase PhoR
LRTPITNLKIRQHLLRRQPDQVDVHLPVIARETDRLSHIIDDLLSLSRMDQGRVELDLQPVDLNQLAQQYVDDRTPLAQQRELTLRFVGTPGLPRVRADEGMLGQALSILLTNALNYTPAGGTVTVEVRDCRQGPDPWGCVAVSDTGPGIQPEEMPQLFERFFRGSAAEITRSRGTGLGLAILKEIITRHGGRVEVESEGIPGKGAVFLLWLPCGGAPAAGEAAQRG